MKNLLYILLLIPFGILAQTPQGFKYQAVIRNANGSLVTNQQVAIKTSLISGSALGNVDYSEQHDVATNGYGVASFTVGYGTPITGTYAAVNWSANDYFLKTELDIQNNGNFQLMGTSQILSVPYASHANTATSSLVDNDTSATNEIQQLSLQGNQLILSGGGSVTLTGTVDLDADPSNELQTLSLSNDTLYLTNGNYVVLPPDSDADTTNEIQTLANTAGTISISGSNTITLADSSATNEIQTLSQTAGSISISNGNTITILDSSATNELQSLSLVGQDSLMITNGNTIKIPSLDNSETNEIQNLSINQNTISISSGNSIDIPIIPINNDNDSVNELQNLTYSNDTLSITNGNNVVIENDNFDWLYPDGKKEITPLISIPNNYSPPSGKRLYVTQLISENNYLPLSPSTTGFNYTGSIQTYTVPNNIVMVTIQAKGAQGGSTSYYGLSGGAGAIILGEFNVTPNEQLKILVGEMGGSSYQNGGGGGSFVSSFTNLPMIVAGGGGGASRSYNGNGSNSNVAVGSGQAGNNANGNDANAAGAGGGFFGSGSVPNGGYSFVNGGAGGGSNVIGGYGGGGGIGSGYIGGAGGGGYSGGNGGNPGSPGSSYNSGINQTFSNSGNLGNGSVSVSVLKSASLFKIDSNVIFSGLSSYNDYGSIFNPIIVDANNSFNYTNDSMSASGFLIDANADYTAVNSALNNTIGSGSGIYTVPSGEILVILNLYSAGSIYAKPPNSSAIIICNSQNSASGNSINVTKNPIFLNEGDIIYGVGTINGYLMNK